MAYGSVPPRDPLTFSEAKEALTKVMDVEAILPRLGLSTNGTATMKRLKHELTVQIAEAVVREDKDCT